MNNKSKLIPRKLIGGLIPKFQNSGHIEKRWYGNVWVEDKPTSYHTEKRWYGTISVPDKVSSKPLPKVDRSVTLAEIDEVKALNANSKPADQNSGIKEGAGKKGGKGRGSESTGKTSTITGKTTTPGIESSTMDVTDENWLKARNDAMTRGYRDYFYNGLRYTFTGDDLKNALANWRINRGRLNNGANGLLGIITRPITIELPIIEDKSIQETDPIIVPKYNRDDGIIGAGTVTKLDGLNNYPNIRNLSSNQDGILGVRTATNTRESNNNNWLKFDPNILLLNPELENRYRAYSKRFTFARKGTKLIPRNGNVK